MQRRFGYLLACRGIVALCSAIAATNATLGATFHVPTDAPTIQAAVDTAETGDEIIVAPGTWAGFAIDSVGVSGPPSGPKGLTIRSEDPSNPDVVQATIISSAFVWNDSGLPEHGVALVGVTITGDVGSADTLLTVENCILDQAGISLFQPFDVNVINSTFFGRGIGVFNLYLSRLSIVGCSFVNCTGTPEPFQGWFGNASAIDIPVGSGGVELRQCSFVGGTKNAISISDASVLLEQCVIKDNLGSGVVVYGSNSSLVLDACEIMGNTTSGDGPGVVFSGPSRAELRNCRIQGNTAGGVGGGVSGDFLATEGLTTICGNVPDQISGTATGVVYVNDECPPPVTLVTELVDPVAEGWSADGYDASAFDTHRVYAVFDEPVAVVGVGDVFDDGIPFEVLVSNSQFHNDALGSDVPPNSALAASFPTMKWDTFVTIGEPTGLGGGGAATTELSPDFTTQANGLDGDFTLDGTGWYVSGYPSHGDAVFDVATGTYRVLIAQFTVEQRERVTGTNWRVSANLGGQGGTSVDVFGDFLTPDPCPADFNGNNAVKFEDLTEVLGHWGACVACTSDIDGDGVVGFSDLTALLTTWGACP